MNADWLDEKRMKKSIFQDIDGCLFWNGGEDTTEIAVNLMENKQKLLEGTREKINEWRSKGYQIIITTGRPKSLKSLTKEQLLQNGIVYDQILFGIGQERHLVNDLNSRGQKTAYAHNVERNAGISNINI